MGLLAFLDEIVIVASGCTVTCTSNRLEPSIFCLVVEFSIGVRGVTAPQESCHSNAFDALFRFQCGLWHTMRHRSC